MVQRLPVALLQLKAGSTSKNLLNEISDISYFLCIKQKKLLKMYI